MESKRNKLLAFASLCVILSTNAKNCDAASLKPYPSATVTNEGDGIENVKAWAAGLAAKGEQEFVNNFGAGAKHEPSPSRWEDVSVYQIFPDRFNNADASNDKKNLEHFQVDQEAAGNLYSVHEYRAGGDIKGIAERMGYLQDLGVGSIWVTPVFTNNGGQYHGYCVSDFLEIDPNFGTLQDMQEMVRVAHQHGILVILDISQPIGHYECSNSLSAKNWNGSGTATNQGHLQFSDAAFGPFKTQYFFNRCGANSQAVMQGTGPAAIFGDFVAEMKDFDTSNHDFQQIFTDIHKYWIAATDVDGFRLDAVKHITEQFVTYFAPTIRKYAESLGKDNFYMVGEIAADNNWISRFLGTQFNQGDNVPASLLSRIDDMRPVFTTHQKYPQPGLNGAFHFAHSGEAREAFRQENGKNFAGLENSLAVGSGALFSHGDRSLLYIHPEIHDWNRFISGSQKNNMNLMIAAQAYFTFAQGIPVMYYGAELGFNGECDIGKIDQGVGDGQGEVVKYCNHEIGDGHALYRQTMWEGGMYNLGSAVDTVNSKARIGSQQENPHHDWKLDPYLVRGVLYNTVRKMQHIRQSCVALRRGEQFFRWVGDSTDKFLSFSRIHEGEEAIVMINWGGSSKTVPSLHVDNTINAAGNKFVNLLNTENTATVQQEGGSLKLVSGMQLGQGEFAVFVKEQVSGEYDAELQVTTCKGYVKGTSPPVETVPPSSTVTSPPSPASTTSPPSPATGTSPPSTDTGGGGDKSPTGSPTNTPTNPDGTPVKQTVLSQNEIIMASTGGVGGLLLVALVLLKWRGSSGRNENPSRLDPRSVVFGTPPRSLPSSSSSYNGKEASTPAISIAVPEASAIEDYSGMNRGDTVSTISSSTGVNHAPQWSTLASPRLSTNSDMAQTIDTGSFSNFEDLETLTSVTLTSENPLFEAV